MKVAKRSAMLKHGVLVFLSLFILSVLIVLIKPPTTGFLTFSDTSQANFNAGTYNNTSYNSTGTFVGLNVSTNLGVENQTGLFTSRVLNAAGTPRWDNISWVEGVPYGENLPDRATVEGSTILGWANMTGNIILFHLDEGSGTIAVDSSGTAGGKAQHNGTVTKFSGTLGRQGGAGLFLNGTGDHIKVNGSALTNFTNAFTIELWLNTTYLNKPSQALVSKWEPGTGNFTNNVSNSWQVIKIAITLNSNFEGYVGAVFDGRYVYFVPFDNGNRHGNLLRYDTTGNFTNNISNSWQVMDMSTLYIGFKGFKGGVFDGKYVYFVPYENAAAIPNGYVVKYDTTGNFTGNMTDTATGHPSWQVMEMNRTLNSNFRGYTGGVFDGRYVYFVPTFNNIGGQHGRVVRYDTTKNFTHNVSQSWQVMDTETDLNSNFAGYFGGIFDGRYVYFVPYQNDAGIHGNVVRYDTTKNFTHNVSQSWQVMEMNRTLNSNFKGYYGGAFDGKYVYFVPRNNGAAHGNVVRYDTTGNFTGNMTDTATGHPSWQVMDMSTIDSNFKGYAGGIFDGKYVYFAPELDGDGQNNGRIVRYDTTGNFTHNTVSTATGHPSWQSMDTSTQLKDNFFEDQYFKGYWGGVFDGRYVYFSATATAAVDGPMLRYNSIGTNSSYSLLYAEDQSGGFAGGPSGLTARITNSTTAFSLGAANTTLNLTNGWHHVAVTYDSNNLTLYIDGINASSKGVTGITMQAATADLIIGAIGSPGLNNTTSSYFNGTIDEVALFNRSLSATEIRNHYLRGAQQLNITVRTSADNVTWTDWVGAGNSTTANFNNSTFGSLTSLDKVNYFQYRVEFGTLTTNWTVELYNVSVNYTQVPSITIHNSSNISIASSNPIVYVNITHPSAASTYVEIISNFSTSNISYGLQQNNTQTARTWNNATVSDGIYIYYARMYDNTTNDVSSGNLTLIVDTTKPTVNASLQLHANQTVTNSSWVANFTIADNLFYKNYSIEVDSVNYTPTGNLSTAAGLHSLYITRTFTLSSSNHTFAAYANDSAGNENKIVNGWINYQATATTATVAAPANNSTIASTVPNITVNVTDNEQLSFYVEVFRNGTNISYASAVQNNTLTNLTWTNASTSQGIYDYYVRAYDNVSNGVSSANRTIILDTTAPTITNVSISPINVTVTNNSAHVFNFSITDNIYLENTSIELNNTANGTAVNYSFTKDATQFNFTINFSALANNNYTIIVYANDSGGNSVRFANNWLNVQVASGGGGGETGGGSTEGGGGGGFTGVGGTISLDDRTLRIPNAEKEVEVFITIPITKNGETTTKTFRAVVRDILTSTAQVRFEPKYEPIVLNPGQEAFVDLNGDGVNDVKVTLNGVAKGQADITFDVIAPPPVPGETTETDELETGEFEEGAAGARELITTRIIAFLSVMALLAVVFLVRFFPEIFGLKVKERKD